MDQIVLHKWLLVSVKGHLCLTKGHLGNPEWQVEVESEVIFEVSIILRKLIFFKKGTFNKASDPQTLYFSKIGPVPPIVCQVLVMV